MKPESLRAIHAAVAAVCPIDGVTLGSDQDKGTWRIDFKSSATAAQRAAARSALDSVSIEALLAAERAKEQRAATLEAQSRSDALLAKLRSASPEEIQQYIQSSIIDLPSARQAITKLAIAVAHLLRNGG